MAATSPEYSWCTKRKRVIKELVQGRDIATQLQDLLLLGKNNSLDHGVQELAMKICTSFSQSLSVLNSCVQIPGDDLGSGFSDQLNSQDSGESVNRSTLKGRRGCYKRRKTLDSRRSVSSKLEDGYSWRKYGQKGILNSKYPRCYFRCTYKHEQGCQALKQNEHKEESSDEQLFSDPLLDSEISWKDDVMGLKLSDKPPMFLSSEIGTNNHKDRVDTSGGYLCGSPNPYGIDVNMDMSLIRSLQFDNWDFHCDQIMSSGELQAGL
ncbi:WRKY DNA-binding transcription factor 70-like [Heracleum sosnowskyi]|uniref:WRKY DNA-binding transcription factor 70-like n=1 Tax=Heracleum sosnowskyi TaxID=360622 RepID=A0AAD8J925_9APIA|nr:WRKY DNA-binding transcription factor 70-like [Heracleum sosnowskyi]